MKRKSLLGLLIIPAVALVLLLGGGIAAVYLVFPPEKVVALILPQAEKAIGRRITIEKAGYFFFPRPGLTLSGLSVENTGREGFTRTPFLTMEKFTACVSVASLFRGHPEITRIALKKPVIRIEVDEQGSCNADDLAPKDNALMRQLPPGIPVIPVPITLRKLVIESGTFIYDDRKTGICATVGTIDQEARIAIDRDLQNVVSDGTLRLSDISVDTKDFRAPLTGLSITVTHDVGADLPAGTITVKRINVSCGKIACVVTGTVKDALTKAPMLDLTLNSPPINVRDLLGLAPPALMPFAPKLSASGTLETGARLQGRLLPGKPPLLTGSAKLTDVTVKYADLPRSISHLNAAMEFTDKSLTVNPLTMRFGTSPIEIRAVVTDFQKRLLDATIKAEINLDEVKDIVKLPPDAELGGKVTADIQIDGVVDPADPGKLFCTGHVDFRQVRLLWPPLARPASINGRIVLAKESAGARFTVAVDRSSLDADATVTHYLYFAAPSGSPNVKRPAIDCKVTSPLLDLDEMLHPPPPAAAEKSAASATPDLLLPMPLPNADLRATLSAKKIVYKGFAMNDVASKIVSVNNIADETFSSGFSTGAIDNALHFDLRAPRKVAFSDKFTVKNVELNDLAARFGDLMKPVTPLNRQLAQIDRGLSGRISIRGALKGAGEMQDRNSNPITGAMNMCLTNGKLENTPVQKTAAAAFAVFLKSDKLGDINSIHFKELNASVRIANGRVYIDDLRILSDFGDWKAEGNVGFDAVMNMDVATRLSKSSSDKVLAVEGAVKGAAKNLFAGTQLEEAAAGLLDNLSLIPRDNGGRISLRFALSGPVNDPKVGALAFWSGGALKATSPSSEAKQREGTTAGQFDRKELKKAGEQIQKKLRELFK